MNRFLSTATLCVALFAGHALQAQAVPQNANEKLVLDFYNMAFNAHQPTVAADRYIGDVYIQHNPNVPNGAGAFKGYFEPYFKAHPSARLQIVRVISEGDLVVTHSKFTSGPEDTGTALVDIFRVSKGKIVEHWDVRQTIPDHTANGNTMFDGTNSKMTRQGTDLDSVTFFVSI